MKRLKIAVTSDYDSLVPMFIENRLEFGMDESVPTDLVKCWSVTDDDGKIQGGAVLAMRQGEYICDGIAVNPKYRKANIGSELLSLMVDEIRKRGGKSLFLVARAPGFFARSGFSEVARDSAPIFFECFGCPQYGTECHPQVMKLEIE
ncbi:MAG: GNAT family N-acetyltransferase [Anaerovoracaceae bacterium]